MLLQCQLQLFEENRWLAWELFWVASLWSGSTVTYLNWAASCVNCEMNWSVASQLNRAHSSQRGDHLARPSQSNREPIPSIPTLRNASEMCGKGPSGANCATPPLTASINLTTPPLSSQSNHPLQPFLWKTIATHSPLEEAHSRANNARAIFAPSSVRCPISR